MQGRCRGAAGEMQGRCSVQPRACARSAAAAARSACSSVGRSRVRGRVRVRFRVRVRVRVRIRVRARVGCAVRLLLGGAQLEALECVQHDALAEHADATRVIHLHGALQPRARNVAQPGRCRDCRYEAGGGGCGGAGGEPLEEHQHVLEAAVGVETPPGVGVVGGEEQVRREGEAVRLRHAGELLLGRLLVRVSVRVSVRAS